VGPPGTGRVDDGHPPGPCGLEQAARRLDRTIQPAASARVGVVDFAYGWTDDAYAGTRPNPKRS
jgi:hypothetical protein